MLSLGRLLMNLSATSLAADIRLGTISGVAIDVEMSNAIIISMPSVSPVCHEESVCGLDNTITTKQKVRTRKKKGK